MITGLIFKEAHEIELDKNNKFTLSDAMIENSIKMDESIIGKNRTSAKDIYFVRYDFGETITKEFIEENMKKFADSVHILRINMTKVCEMYADEEEEEVLDKLENICDIDNIVIHVEVKAFGSGNVGLDDWETRMLIGLGKRVQINELILKDDGTLNNPSLMMIQRAVKKMPVKFKRVAVCGSPFTTCENCCITPELMRDYAATYGTENTALAVNGYRVDKEGCRCLRAIEVTEDIISVKKTAEKKEKVEKKQTDETKEKKEKKKVVKAGKFDNADSFWF